MALMNLFDLNVVIKSALLYLDLLRNILQSYTRVQTVGIIM